MKTPIIAQVQQEQGQGHVTRRGLFLKLEKTLGRPVVSYFTSTNYPVNIEDTDADIIESVLQGLNLSKGLGVLISSHGGYGESAERIINVCRSASGTGEFWAIVPGKAKSAATMICFGASKIYMGASSELGPIDPQLSIREDGRLKRFSLCNLVESYDELFNKAVGEKGNLEPYIQQLSRYDSREIKEYRAAIALSEDIGVRCLANGMMKGETPEAIKKKIEIFLSPKTKKSHGRPIYRDEAENCGLVIEKVGGQDKLSNLIYELYIRTDNLVSTSASKCVESTGHSFTAVRREK